MIWGATEVAEVFGRVLQTGDGTSAGVRTLSGRNPGLSRPADFVEFPLGPVGWWRQ